MSNMRWKISTITQVSLYYLKNKPLEMNHLVFKYCTSDALPEVFHISGQIGQLKILRHQNLKPEMDFKNYIMLLYSID